MPRNETDAPVRSKIGNPDLIPIPAEFAAILAILLVCCLFVLFMLERYPPEVTAAGVAAAFLVFGLVSQNAALAAFSNPAPLTIAAMFVISGALVRTGLLDALAGMILSWAESSPIGRGSGLYSQPSSPLAWRTIRRLYWC